MALVLRNEPSFVEAVKQTFPAHYQLYNTELYFSNMLMTDLGLKDKAYKIVCYMKDAFAITVTYNVKPFIVKNMAKLYWLIRFKILFENFRLHPVDYREEQKKILKIN
jgi:hypothetical protein